MKIYLDTSVYNRPYDDQTQAKIYLETQAVLIIFYLIETQQVESVNSSVLEYENKKNPFPIIKNAIQNYLSKSCHFQTLNESIKHRAKELEKERVTPIDALHVACFEASKSDYFLTCDKRLLNRCQTLAIPAFNPIHFIEILNNEN